MKVLTYLVQIIAAIVYTVLATWIFSWLMNLVIRWMVQLSVGWMIFLLIVGIGVIWAILTGISNIGIVPYFWTNKNNIVSVVLSVILTVSQVIFWIVSIWRLPHDGRFVPIVTLIFASIILLSFGGTFVTGQIAAYNNHE